MGPIEARRIEDESNGEITRQMLCQKTWDRIWPELIGQEGEANVVVQAAQMTG